MRVSDEQTAGATELGWCRYEGKEELKGSSSLQVSAHLRTQCFLTFEANFLTT
jgi:hypothetical protein